MTAELEAERKVLGAVLAFGGDALALVLEAGVTREAFFHDDHGRLWELLEKQSNAGAPLETLAICTLLMGPGQDADRYGGVGYVSSLADDVPALNSVGWFARQLLDLDSRRKLRHLASWLEAQATSGRPVDDVVAAAAGMLDRVNAAEQADSVVDGAGLADALWATLITDEAAAPTLGDPDLDELFGPALGGVGRLSIIAARAGMGKTALVLNVLLRLAKQGIGVGLLSMEQPHHQVAKRLCSIDGAAPFSKVDGRPAGMHPESWHGAREWERINAHLEMMSQSLFFVDDRSGMSLAYIRSRLVRLAAKMKREGQPLRVVAVDYIQRARCPGENRPEALATFCKGLADVARDLKLSMLALSQFNRAIDQRGPGAMPRMSDLSGSSGI